MVGARRPGRVRRRLAARERVDDLDLDAVVRAVPVLLHARDGRHDGALPRLDVLVEEAGRDLRARARTRSVHALSPRANEEGAATHDDRVQAQVAPDARVLEPAAHEDGRAVDRARRDDDRLPSAHEREAVLAVADEGADAVAPRRRWRVLVERVGRRERGGRRRGEQEALDGRFDEELGAVLRGVLEPRDGATLLLAVDAAEAAEAARVLVAARVLLRARARASQRRDLLKAGSATRGKRGRTGIFEIG